MNDQNLKAAAQSINDVHALIQTVFTQNGDAAHGPMGIGSASDNFSIDECSVVRHGQCAEF